MTAAVYTLGCKVNQYESQVICEELLKSGYEVVPPDRAADVYIVNSCTVTAESDRKTRQAVRRLKRMNPNAALVLTGCVPQAYPEVAAELPQADILLGNKSNDKIIEALTEWFRDKSRLILTDMHNNIDKFCVTSIKDFHERTRANVKIEDGCDRFCAYCIVPHARGRARSKPLKLLREEVRGLAESGFQEIVLVGINLSAYSDGGHDLCDAVETAASFGPVKRVRLGSLEPDHLTDGMIGRLSRIEKLCPQFHISLQSGCDETLRAMSRHYIAAEYEALCRKLREIFPGAALTTDIMVGFPGETDENFRDTMAFTEQIGFEKAHVFPYSKRPGTKAADMPGHLPKSVKEQRCRELTALADRIRHDFLKAQIGRTVEVLVEENNSGYTKNYIPVQIVDMYQKQGFVNIKITDADEDTCFGYVE